MQWLIADKPTDYAGKRYRTGQRFQVENRHVGIFTTLGNAHIEPPPEKPRRKYKRRDMVAENNTALNAAAIIAADDDFSWCMDNPHESSSD